MVALALILLFGGLGIFLVPWFIPQRQLVCSASSTLGFNNIAATVALAALLAALFVYRLLRPAQPGGGFGRTLESLVRAPAATGSERSPLIAFGVVTTLIAAVLLFWYRTLPFIFYGEFGADVSRLELMVLGLKPYRDFQYNYGPAMLYPAYWVYRLAGDRLTVEAAYCVTLLTHWVAGLYLLFGCVMRLCRGPARAVVFLCLALAVCNFSLGVGYTPLRFIAPLAALLLLHRAFGRWCRVGTGGGAKITALTALLSQASLSLSTEIGIATAAGSATYLASLFFSPLRGFAAAALAPLCSLGLALLLFSPGYLESILSVGGGANNFPVFPTPHILFLVVAACLILPLLGTIGVRERNQTGALAAGLVATLGPLLAGAFGRCDPGHVLFNGLGILVLLLATAVNSPARAKAALTVGAFLVVFPGLGAYTLYRTKEDLFQKPVEYRNQVARLSAGLNEQLWNSASEKPVKIRYGKMLPFQEDLRELLQYATVGTPFYTHDDVDRFLKLTGRYVTEYYAGINMQVYTPAEVARKIRDLDRMEVVLVPKDHGRYPVFVSESGRGYLSNLLFFPAKLIPRPRRPPYVPGREVVNHLKEHFTVIGEFRSWEIWRRSAIGR